MIKFKELKQYLSRIARVSVCHEADLSYENYILISDIPEGKYDEMYVYGVGMIDVEFPLDVYARPGVEVPAETSLSDGYFIGAGLEVMVRETPRDDIKRSDEKVLKFKDLRKFLQLFGGFSVVRKEDWSSKEYEKTADIPYEYDELFVYGIGMEDKSKGMEDFKGAGDSIVTKQMVIVLSETPRQLVGES